MTITKARPLNTFTVRRRSVIGASARKLISGQNFFLVALAAHLPLGVVLYNIGSLKLIHPLAVFAWGIKWAIDRKVPLRRVALPVGYLIGAEVLWRMAQVPVFWEFGKYGSAAIMITALLIRSRATIPSAVAVYFLSLLPACLVTVAELGPQGAIGPLSASMSGPLCLAVSCWFFSSVQFGGDELKNAFCAVMVPLLSVAAATLFYTVTQENIQFTTESNFATAGGFGPNQVSTMLGLGLFLSAAFLLLFRVDITMKVVLSGLALFFTAQSVMTFSRSGVYNAIGALIFVVFFASKDIGAGIKKLLPVMMIAATFLFLVFPYLNDFTGGKLQERFEETQTANRTEIIESDYALFLHNPVLGSGVGLSRTKREEYYGDSAASHTEFSRLIADHGMFGLLALMALGLIVAYNLRTQPTSFGRSVAMGSACWAGLYMINSGMRLAAPAIMIGLGCALIVPRKFPAFRKRLRRSFRPTGNAGKEKSPVGEDAS